MTDNVATGAGRREWIGLAVLGLPTLLLSIDLSVLNLALPHLSIDLGTSAVQQLWIIDIYAFMVAGFLITMGTVGDRIGRRKLLLIGAGAFGVASVIAAFSTSAEMLIGARALMGVAGATLAPSTLALIVTMFYRNPKQMGTAIGVWVGCFMGGLALGPIVGGAMLHFFWWGSVFLLGVPVMLVLLALGPVFLPEAKNPAAGRPDLISVALSLAAILPVIYGIKQLAQNGWSLAPIAAILLGLAFGAVFLYRQHRLTHPLIDLGLFSNRSFSAALVITVFGASIGGGTILVVNLYLQMVAGLTPLQAGLLTVPSGFAMVATAMTAPAFARRFPPAYVIATGLTVAAAGYILLTQVNSVGGLAVAVIGVSITSAGSGPQASLTTNLVLASTPPQNAGAAASISETSGQLGIAMGAAIMGSIATAVYGSQLTNNIPAGTSPAAADAAGESVVTGVATATQLPDPLGTELLGSVREAFTSGLHVVSIVSAVLLVCLAALAVATLRHVRPTGEAPAPAPEAAEAEGVVEPAV